MRFPLLVSIHAALVAGILLPGTALAADGEDTPLKLGDGDAVAAPSSGGGGGTLVRTIVGLVVVIAVIYGLTWVLRQVKSSREGAAAGKGLTALATLPLANDRSLHLVRVGDDVVLVGAGSAGVSSVRSWTLEEAREAGLVGAEDEEEDGPGAGPAGSAGNVGNVGNVLEKLRSRTVLR